MKSKWLIIGAFIVVFLMGISYENTYAQQPQHVSAEEQINPCRVVGGWLGEIWCYFIYISVVETVDTDNPNPTPTPEPEPTPTPVPVEFEYLQSEGVETVEPWKPWQNVPECHWTGIWRHCQIQVRFEITQVQCPDIREISLRYSDDTYKNARISIEKYWADEEDRLWLQFYRLAYDYESGFEAWRYTATVSCAK